MKLGRMYDEAVFLLSKLPTWNISLTEQQFPAWNCLSNGYVHEIFHWFSKGYLNKAVRLLSSGYLHAIYGLLRVVFHSLTYMRFLKAFIFYVGMQSGS